VIEIDRSRVTVWDSLNKPPELYQNLVDMKRAWSRFLKTQLGVTSTPTKLEFNHNKPVRISHIYFHLFKHHGFLFLFDIHFFAGCRKMHTATSLPCARQKAHSKGPLCRHLYTVNALPCVTHSKAFAVCFSAYDVCFWHTAN